MDAADDRQQWVVLGQLTRPHGVRGAVRARWYSPPAALIAPPRELRLRRGNQSATLRVLEDRPTGPQGSLLQLAGLDSPTSAGAWRGAQIEVPRALVPPAGPDEVYLFELLGRPVQTVTGRPLGTASRLYDYGAGPVLGIAPAPGPDGAAAPRATELNFGAAAPERVANDSGAAGNPAPPDVAADTGTPPPRPRRGKRRRVRAPDAQELLVPLSAGVLRDFAPEGAVVLDLDAAHLEAP